MKRIILISVIGLLYLGVQAQTIENNKSTLDSNNGTLTITYDLIYTDATQKFSILFFSSHDNFSKPLKFITGDGGDNVLSGRMKRAIWSYQQELPSDFDGDIQIKIRPTKMIAPKLIMEPLATSSYKKGGTISMKWTGGNPGDKITIDLDKNNSSKLKVAEKIDNSGAFEWKIPKNESGKNYRLVITNASQSAEPAPSTEFTIKPRIPLLVKVLPVVLVGGAAAILLSGGPSTPANDVLPKPVKPN